MGRSRWDWSAVSVGCAVVLLVTLAGEFVCGVIGAAFVAGMAAFGADVVLFAQHDPTVSGVTIFLDALALIPGFASLRNAKTIKTLIEGTKLLEDVAPILTTVLALFARGRLAAAIGDILDEMVSVLKAEARLAIRRGIGLDLTGIGLQGLALPTC